MNLIDRGSHAKLNFFFPGAPPHFDFISNKRNAFSPVITPVRQQQKFFFMQSDSLEMLGNISVLCFGTISERVKTVLP